MHVDLPGRRRVPVRRRPAVALALGLLLLSQAGCSTPQQYVRGLSTPGPQPAHVEPGQAGPLMPLYVSPTGDDDAPGTLEAPVQSIEQAAEMARPGTTVVLADGVYDGPIHIRASGTPTARITFTSENPRGARIVGGDDGSPVLQNDGDYVDITGLEITGTTSDGLLNTGSYVRIVGNSVHGFREDSCVFTYSEGYDLHDVDIVGNVVSGCGSDARGHGIYVGHTGGVVSNNISFGNRGFGIHCWHNCNALTISNNVVFDNGEGGIIIGQGDGPNYGDVAADGFVVANNIAVRNGDNGIEEFGATGPDNVFLNNIVHDNGEAPLSLQTGRESGTLDVDPEFVDFQLDGSGDYRLRPTSPGVDAGTSRGAPSADIDGVVRPQGAGFDIGAYER